MVHTSNLHV